MKDEKLAFTLTELQKIVGDAELRATKDTLSTMLNILTSVELNLPIVTDGVMAATYSERLRAMRRKQLKQALANANDDNPDYLRPWRGLKSHRRRSQR